MEWERVMLQEKASYGEFTFQVTVHKNGDILFVYNNLPILINNITDFHHPVKVGLSDAYILDRTEFRKYKSKQTKTYPADKLKYIKY